MADEQKLFEKDVGTWDGEIEVRPFPGAEPQRSTGVMTNRWLGGRWLVSDFKNSTGFEGRGIYGWDDAKRCYVGTWVDPMRSSLVIAVGSFDKASHTMTYSYELQHGERVLKLRDVTEMLDDGLQRFRSLLALDGGDHAIVTATYRRRAEH